MQLQFLFNDILGLRPKTPPAPVAPSAPDECLFEDGRKVPMIFARNERARRYLLRLTSDGMARVTVPRRGSMREARAFVERHKKWLLGQVLKWEVRPRVGDEWIDGTEIFYRGEKIRLAVDTAQKRIRFGDQDIPLRAGVAVRRQVENRLLALARQELPERIQLFAAQQAFSLRRVSIRSQRSRWGSCSSRGTVSLNWRLIQMPPLVCDYILWHELTHLREMNHSRRFWARVAEVCPDYQAAERWIKQHGVELGLR